MEPDLGQIVEHLSHRRAEGRIIHLSPNTAGRIEKVLRERAAQPDAPRKYHPAETMSYRIEEWDREGNRIVASLAFMTDLAAAQAAWAVYRAAKPFDRLTLRHGTHVLAEQPWSDKFADAR
jgi:hypothetical protein